MSKANLKRYSHSELVDQNYIHAYVLYYFGIRFYEYSALTLEQVCEQRGLKVDQVIREMESPTYLREAELPLVSYPIDLIIEYLKHSHFLFIKHKLPYITRLVESFKAIHPDYETVERDMKIVFPLFVADFIEHIYEEEDTLFSFILALEKASKSGYIPTKLFYLLERTLSKNLQWNTRRTMMKWKGIRNITKDYKLDANAPLHVKVLYNELKAFESSLITHARIENEILFPKAMSLENKVKLAFFEKSKFN
jgi:regulator of cell morphogenesis and NO signaling